MSKKRNNKKKRKSSLYQLALGDNSSAQKKWQKNGIC